MKMPLRGARVQCSVLTIDMKPSQQLESIEPIKERIVRRAFPWAVILWFTVELGVLALCAGVAPAQEDLTYKIYCSRCHGDAGHGDGADAGTLKAHPRDFTDCAGMAKIPDDTMFKAIKDGGAAVGVSGDMPAWGAGLSDDDIHAVMKYVRHFCQK